MICHVILCNTYLEYSAASKAGLNTHSNEKGGQETLIPSKYENTRKAREEFFPFENRDIKYFCVNSSYDESTKIRLNKSE